MWAFVFYNIDVRHVICEGLYFIRTMFAMLYVMVCILSERCFPCYMRGFLLYKNDVRHVILWGFVFYQNNVPHVICEGLYFIRTMFAMLYVRVCISYERCSPCYMWEFVFYKNDLPRVICEGLYFIRTMFAMLYERVCIS